MRKIDLSKTIQGIGSVVKQHSPEILMGIGIAGMISTTVLAVKATPKALMLIEERKLDCDVDALTPVETVKTTWKCYIPAAVTGTVSLVCLLGSGTVNARRSAALTTAYSLSETALREYKSKVVETLGEKNDKKVREAIAKDKIESNPVREVIITDKGNTLFYDELSGRYFRYDIEKFNAAINNLNSKMIRQTNYISVNDLYNELDIPELCPTKTGYEVGWNITQNGLIEVDLIPHKADNGQPCFYIDFIEPPRYEFDKWL